MTVQDAIKIEEIDDYKLSQKEIEIFSRKFIPVIREFYQDTNNQILFEKTKQGVKKWEVVNIKKKLKSLKIC